MEGHQGNYVMMEIILRFFDTIEECALWVNIDQVELATALMMPVMPKEICERLAKGLGVPLERFYGINKSREN